MKFLLGDRDSKFTAALDAVFTGAGIRILRSPIHAPRANAIMQRWIGGCRRELLDRTLIWNQRHLLRVHREYEAHHNTHCLHRALGQAAPLKPYRQRSRIPTTSVSVAATGSAASSARTDSQPDPG